MRRTELIMGMPITIEVDGSDKEAALEAAFGRFREIDAVYSTYKPDSVISRISRGELAVAEAPAEVRSVLEACEEWKEKTDGYFDIARPDGRIDPSGLVKGWAIAEVARGLAAAGCDAYFVEAGGDIQCAGREWEIGIRHPVETDKVAKRLRVRGGIATSGTYERGAHIYNPKTGKQVLNLLSLTVVGPDVYVADLLATSMFAAGDPDLPLLARFPGYEAYVITATLRALATPGMAAYSLT